MLDFMVVGGLGFIGVNLIHALRKDFPDSHITILDKLTYAANDVDSVQGLADVCVGDVCDSCWVSELLKESVPEYIFYLAAESHVDNSHNSPLDFWKTNVLGAATFFGCVRQLVPDARIIALSTDEVYGGHPGIDKDSAFREDRPYKPSSPYAASKVAQELVYLDYAKSFDLDIAVVRPNNVYGPWQHEEKFIPKTIKSIIKDEPVTLYGEGKQSRPWMYVEDLCSDLLQFPTRGVYNISSRYMPTNNIDLIFKIAKILDKNPIVKFVPDRKNHDFTYLTNDDRFREIVGSRPQLNIDDGLKKTVEWYADKYV